MAAFVNRSRIGQKYPKKSGGSEDFYNIIFGKRPLQDDGAMVY